MKSKTKRRWGIIRYYIVGWTIAFLFLAVIKGMSTETSAVQFKLWESVLASLVFGSFFGGISGYIQILIEERYYRRISIQRLVLFRLIYVIILLSTISLLSYIMVSLFFEEERSLIAYVLEPESGTIYLYFITADILMLILRQVSLMLGEGNLWKLLRGKFYSPREEERIFMFLDLQSSTQHAENLGHIKYSKMIQDCFSDLGVVAENEAEIYQYVGDEVILTWKLKDGLRNLNCINAYFNFKSRLKKRQKYYQENYNFLPFFKAGLHAGIITVTEVGKYKREIAYHGDTINTAARIQGKCNDYKEELLLSDHLMARLSLTSFEFKQLGSIPLKGKENKIVVHAVYSLMT